MSFNLAPHAFALSVAAQMSARVMGKSELMGRPQFVIKAVAARLRIGVRAVEAFLRRILILMALEMEPDLVFVLKPENMARKKESDRLKLRAKKPHFRIYTMPDKPYYFDFEARFPPKYELYQPHDFHTTDADTHAAAREPVKVDIANWLARLDQLQDIALDPIAKARRLARSLAKTRPGILRGPPQHHRVMRRQGTEAEAIYDAMAFQIMQRSRTRPPPLPPPRRGPKPSITVLDWGPDFLPFALRGRLRLP
jgi:hypothetical protein